MAIAFVAAGARTKADVSLSGAPLSVALPAGHAAGHWLVMYVVTEDNVGPSTPSGWSFLGGFAPGDSAPAPYAGRPHVDIYHRIDTGALGSSVSVPFSTFPWPNGDPYVLAWVEAYSGVDNAGPVESVQGNSTLASTAAHAHPTATTISVDAWLLSFRAVGADAAKTFTISGGTNTERVDDTTGFPASPSAASYSAGPLTPGVQTQRTTTASGALEYGSVAVSIVIKPSGTVNATPSAREATGTVTAYNPTVQTSNGSWDLCADLGTPEYSMRIDWNGDGSFISSEGRGDTLVTDTFDRVSASSWGTADTGQAWSTSGGSAADYSVGGDFGFHSCGTRATSRFTFLTAGSPDQDLSVLVAADQLAAGGSIHGFLLGRLTDVNNLYMARLTMSSAQVLTLTVRSRVAGVETQIGSYTLSAAHEAGMQYRIRLRCYGTMIYAKAWPVIVEEPGWQISVTDSAVPAAGTGAGVRTFLDGTTTNTLPVLFSFGSFQVRQATDPEDVTPDIISEVAFTYGRDQDRQLSPASIGNGSFVVNNTSRKYSPENPASMLAGSLDPARPTQWTVTWGGTTYPLFKGRVDDYDLHADFADRTVSFSFLDGLSLLQGVRLSTGVYRAMRIGDLVNVILDLAGWTGPRSIDPGATIVPFWWAEGTDALSAIQDLVKSEGPPAVAYQAPDGTFVFRDRHHRMLYTESLTSQATFAAAEIGCESPAASGFDYTKPFVYSHGWRDIINSVTFDITERHPDALRSVVWTSEGSFSLSLGQSIEIEVTTSDPFLDALTPVQGTDFTKSGPGTVNVVLSRDSGAAARITMLAVGGQVTISGLQLRARAIPVSRTIKVVRQDTASISSHGERTYPEEAPWANANDAAAIANMILLHYAQRRATVQLRVVTSDPAHFLQVLRRTISDRIHIINGETGLADDFFVERVSHTLQRFNKEGQPPVHSVVLGCEKQLTSVTNPFTFDKRGAGFDDGVFDPIQADNAATVFIFDHPIQGRFDTGLFGT